jgi:peptidoglycan/LPS O-acetylase OafA/YrhL
MNRGIPGLDRLRAVSIGLVVVAHLSGTRGFPQINLSGLGEFGVRVFS